MDFPVKDERIGNIYRRMIMNRLQTFAIHEVEVMHNSSILTEEMIAFNLAWLRVVEDAGPTITDDNFPQAFTLDVQNTTRSHMSVTGSDFVAARNLPFSLDPHGRVACLAPGQRLQLQVSLRRGRGSEHCKYCPAQRVGLTQKNRQWSLIVRSLEDGQESALMQRAQAELASLCDRLRETVIRMYPSTDPESERAASRETQSPQTEPVRCPS